ncbi:MAG: peptide deformylase, partial [Verrucomicrobia bacterium]|nr:peptide deformylase [Verrucomicrobiota bacterium]
LRKKAESVDSINPLLINFINRMKEVCAEKKGLGIAAPQVNESVSIFVTPMIGTHIKTKDPIYAKNFEDWTVVINPKIVRYSQEYVGYEEGCLSLPKLYSTVFRPKAIDVVYQDINLKTQSKVLTHWFARLFLHEYDHLHGILFTDYLLGKISNGTVQDVPFEEKLKIQKKLNDFELEARGST